MADYTKTTSKRLYQTSNIHNNQNIKYTNKLLTSIFLSLLLVLQVNCQSLPKASSKEETDNLTGKSVHSNLEIKYNKESHNCSEDHLSNIKNDKHNSDSDNKNNNKITSPDKNNGADNSIAAIKEILDVIKVFNDNYIKRRDHETAKVIENQVLDAVDKVLSKDTYQIVEGVKIELSPGVKKNVPKETEEDSYTGSASPRSARGTTTALQDSFGFNEKFFERIKRYARNHVLSINLPNAARLFSFRSFGLKKLLLPIFIGAQVVKSVLIAMFLPSILGSLGKIVGKGLSQISTGSSQASFPPADLDGVDPYNRDLMGYQTDQNNPYAYPLPDVQDQYTTGNDVNDLSDVALSRYGPGGAKVTYVPSKSDNYYKNNQANTNYKVFHKIPASSMILSNYDPFYSPLLSRLDGIFSRLGLAPGQSETEDPSHFAGVGQSLSQIKLESCREQLICLMYASPAKYAPYSNLVSAQLSRELNELRRPTSDNAEILRFFRYMRAARRGQEGGSAGCGNTCATTTQPEHTMIAAYHDINKLVTARKLNV